MVKLATLFLISFNNGAAAGCGDAQWIHKTAILGQLLVVSYRDGNDLRLLIHLPGSKYYIEYGYGYLLANEIAENYQSLMKSLLGMMK
ncbi:hypothetical protein GBAR_LOCUS19443 [Geodia barretti]|uniref:Uncharacterized protein n=1 Tax=Geodia barretti TaxID=519541 RepID=A0AA35SSJ3_GEOBA|nr:hypothetical protein GBAR_LOCUS19443 [Geodia barretti]